MISSTETLFLNHRFIYPRTGNTLVEKLIDCYEQLTETPIEAQILIKNVVKQSVFIKTESNTEYYQTKEALLSCAAKFFDTMPPTSIIPEIPENGSLVLEITTITGFDSHQIHHRKNTKNSWTAIELGEDKLIFASGFTLTSPNTDILAQSEEAFKQLENLLHHENMEFSNIIRQWNYIERITHSNSFNGEQSQHYQIFNDVRSKYYSKATFHNGYPSATGIGMDFGGIIIDVIAFKSGDQSAVLPIKSNVQVDAYKYSNEVLAENKIMTDFTRSTPKFERAKLLNTPLLKYLFVSGTAAIKGQTSAPMGTVEEQTEMTIQNIFSLIALENLKKNGATLHKEVQLNQLRVYVKYLSDIINVKQVCQKHFPSLPIIYLVADICRPELLVEIEGQAIVE